MEPLSPRSGNIQAKPISNGKQAVKPAGAKKPSNLKEHAPKPPPVVVQPPVDEESLSENYKTGNHLGKGGFAVCYEGELQCEKQSMKDRIYALKIVPAKMNHKKMEDKVCLKGSDDTIAVNGMAVPNRAPDTCEASSPKHCRISPSIYFQRKHLHCA